MRHPEYFIIRPKDSLQNLVRKHVAEPFSWSIFEAHILTIEISDRTWWSIDDFKERVKLVYLADLVSDYGSAPNKWAELISEIIGGAPITQTIFDEWWELEQIHYLDSIESIENNLEISALQKIKSKSNTINQWLAYMSQKKQTT